MLFIFCNTIKATAGGLRSSSIKTCPDGITYGLHSDGNGGTHWHQAAKNAQGMYYPTGEVTYYQDPCPESNKNQGTVKNTKPGSNDGSTRNNSSIGATTGVSVIQESNDATIKVIKINGDSINVSDTMKYISKKKTATIYIETNNSNAKYQIDGDLDKLDIEQVNMITIRVEAPDGTIKDYIIEITREIQKSYVRIINLKLNDKSITFDFNNKEEITVVNEEDKLSLEYQLSNSKATLLIKKDNQVVLNGDQLVVGKNNYTLVVVDEDGNENKYELVIKRMTKFESIISFIVGLIVFAIIILLVIKNIKKKR